VTNLGFIPKILLSLLARRILLFIDWGFFQYSIISSWGFSSSQPMMSPFREDLLCLLLENSHHACNKFGSAQYFVYHLQLRSLQVVLIDLGENLFC
jgi:hypothetical protein